MDERPTEFMEAVRPFVARILQQQPSGAHPTDVDQLTDALNAPEQPLQAVDATNPKFDSIPVATEM